MAKKTKGTRKKSKKKKSKLYYYIAMVVGVLVTLYLIGLFLREMGLWN